MKRHRPSATSEANDVLEPVAQHKTMEDKEEWGLWSL